MTAPEPSFAVPLSALIDIWDYCQDGWLWSCRVRGHCAPAEANSQAEARSAVIAHLADVHGITPLVEETGEAAALPGWEQHLRSLASGGAQFVDQVSLQLVVEELARLRAEVARLRSAGDGAADVGYVIGYRRKLPGLDWEGDWYQTRERADQELSRCQNEGYVFAVFEVRKAVDR